jgi:hypothetical protein
VADVLGDAPDRRTWHRDASSAEPLEEVAAELETAAARAQHKGGLSVAIVALERAAQLTTDPTLRCNRLLQAAESAFEEGQPTVALRLMSEAAKLPLSTRDRARFQWLNARLLPNDTASGSAARPTRMDGVEVRRVFDRVRSVAVEKLQRAVKGNAR